MGWAQTTRVLLVWPPRGRILARRIDLMLLQRHARQLGAQLALITTDPLVREYAREVGLPAFRSLKASQGRPWRARPLRQPVRQKPPLDPAALRAPAKVRLADWPAWLPWALKSLIFLAALGGLAALALAVVPGASVTLTPAQHPIVTVVPVVADPALKAIQGASVPARQVRVEVETTGQTATTGLTEVPSLPAAGSVVFTSLDGVVTAIPVGTGLRTTSGDQVRFQTLQTAKIDARLGATVVVAIQAVDLGPAGNVAPGQINAIDGPLGLELAATNATATSGGARSQKASVSADDRARLHNQLLQQLQVNALSALQAQVSPGEFLAPDSVAVANEVAQTYDLAVGEQANTVQLTLRVAFTGLVIANRPAQQVAQTALLALVLRGQALLPGSENYVREVDTHTGADGRVSFNIDARGIVVPIIDPDRVRGLVKGQPVADAAYTLVSALPLSGSPVISIQPDWYPRLPWMPFRIHVAIAGGS